MGFPGVFLISLFENDRFLVEELGCCGDGCKVGCRGSIRYGDGGGVGESNGDDRRS